MVPTLKDHRTERTILLWFVPLTIVALLVLLLVPRRLGPAPPAEPLRCAECNLEIRGTPVEAHGKVFCNPWHAKRYPRTHPPWWKRA